MKEFFVSFELKNSEFNTALRLVAGAFCTLAERNVDEAEDFKVCVTESALILKNCGFDRLNAKFSAEDGVKAVLSGEGGTPAEVNGENELSLALISALVEKCGIERREGVINSVTLEL